MVLFYTYVTQLLQSIWKSKESHNGSAANLKHLGWLQIDVGEGDVPDYFPAKATDGIHPSVDHPVDLKLSVLLEAFQQFCQRFESLLQDNHSLQRKAKLAQDLIKRNSSLQAKVQGLQHNGQTHPTSSMTLIQDLESELRHTKDELQTLQRAYSSSEERCKQLVEVTQQWSAECADKDKLIAVQTTQIEQLQAEIDKLQKKVSKYKKHWLATKDAIPGQRASDAQFEELRLELACRRELHDQVCCLRVRNSFC